jgi:outer membrane protein
MKKIFFLLLVSGVFTVPAVAQHSFSIQYSMGFGGTINNFITSTSLRGATFEYKVFPDPQVSIGIDAGWNHFYERHAFDTYTSGTRTYSGTQFRYADAVPIYLTTTYYFIPGNKVNPFIGVGIGTIYLSRYVDMGIFRVTEDEWHFGVKPEFGALVSLSPDMDFILSLRYNKAFATEDTADQSFMSFNIGFVWK